MPLVPAKFTIEETAAATESHIFLSSFDEPHPVDGLNQRSPIHLRRRERATQYSTTFLPSLGEFLEGILPDRSRTLRPSPVAQAPTASSQTLPDTPNYLRPNFNSFDNWRTTSCQRTIPRSLGAKHRSATPYIPNKFSQYNHYAPYSAHYDISSNWYAFNPEIRTPIDDSTSRYSCETRRNTSKMQRPSTSSSSSSSTSTSQGNLGFELFPGARSVSPYYRSIVPPPKADKTWMLNTKCLGPNDNGKVTFQCLFVDPKTGPCTYEGAKETVKRHFVGTHQKFRPHICIYPINKDGEPCNKTFPQSASLKIHICSVHTGETPYRCKACPEAFSDPSKRSKHLSKAHEELVSKLIKPRKKAPFADCRKNPGTRSGISGQNSSSCQLGDNTAV